MFLDSKQRYPEPTAALAINFWVDIQAPATLVFKMITTGAGLQRWWANQAETDPRPGGALTFSWTGSKARSAKAFFRRFEPPLHVVWEWLESDGHAIQCDGRDPRGMRWAAINAFHLTQINAQTTRVFVHDHGINPEPAYKTIRKATLDGWREALAQLRQSTELEAQRLIRKKAEATKTAKAREEKLRQKLAKQD